MKFSDIVGHRKQIDTLKKSLEVGRLHHAYLFAGPDGIGKRTVAVALAAAIHCSNEGHSACGRCDACQLRLKGFAEAGVTDPARYSVASNIT